MVNTDIKYYTNLLKIEEDDSLSRRELKKLVDEIYNESQYSRWFGQWLLTKLICLPVGLNLMDEIYKSKLLELYIPDFKDSHLIPQEKKYGKNLWEHSLMSYSNVQDIVILFNLKDLNHNIFNMDYNDVLKILYFSALLHDIGKIYDVNTHCHIGMNISREVAISFVPFVDVIGFETIVPIIVKNHMRPLGVQRGEVWNDNAIEKFIFDSHDRTTAMLTVMISSIDKYVSSKNLFYLEPLIKLFLRIYKF